MASNLGELWEKVSTSEKYQSLDETEKENVRNDFFNDFVAPQVETPELESVRAQFDDDTQPVGRAGTAVGQFVRGVGHVVSSAQKSVAIAQGGGLELAERVV